MTTLVNYLLSASQSATDSVCLPVCPAGCVCVFCESVGNVPQHWRHFKLHITHTQTVSNRTVLGCAPRWPCLLSPASCPCNINIFALLAARAIPPSRPPHLPLPLGSPFICSLCARHNKIMACHRTTTATAATSQQELLGKNS